MKGPGFPLRRLMLLLPLATTASTGVAAASDDASAMLEEVVVRARKLAVAEFDAPLAIDRLGSDELQSLQIRDLTRLTTGLPGVALDDVGTRRGTANFSIRGLGINSSIPSIDPTVGVFINDVYIGINNDTVFDLFDLESIDVLRGPQGVLFGRNVTGGALLLQTAAPTARRSLDVAGGVEGGGDGGLTANTSLVLNGPLTSSLQGRLALYASEDEGYFSNRYDGEDAAGLTQLMGRVSLNWQPGEHSSLLAVYEHGRLDGEGPAAQSHRNGAGIPGTPFNAPRDSLQFSNDEPGYQDVTYDNLSLTWNQSLAGGQLTNVFGYRDQSSEAMSDIDSQPDFLFHSPGWIDYEQWSNELRYQRRFADSLTMLGGIYLFESDLAYHDRRLFQGDAGVRGSSRFSQDGGGLQDVSTVAVFLSGDYELSERLTLGAGLRYSEEEKTARVASFDVNTATSCNIVTHGDCFFDFEDRELFTSLAPSLSVSYSPDDHSQWYARYTRSYRSGGYNLRNSNSAEPPGPVDQETVDGFEAGLKRREDKWQFEGALFYTRVGDMQREVSLPSESAGILQLLRNTADADLSGVEASGSWQATPDLRLHGDLAWLHARYRTVRYDLNGDGVVDSADKSLDLPRAPQWTGGLGGTYALAHLSHGELELRLNYAYRDEVAYTDNNLGFIQEQHLLDADLRLRSHDGRREIAFYARNLTNSVKHGGDSQLPALFIGEPLGGTFSPLARGRIYGVSLRYRLGG